MSLRSGFYGAIGCDRRLDSLSNIRISLELLVSCSRVQKCSLVAAGQGACYRQFHHFDFESESNLSTRITMPAKSRFTKLDAFTKTVDEARIRTTSGGIVTIVSLLVVLLLSWGEWVDYRRVVIHPELVVDKSRGMGNSAAPESIS